MHSTIPSNTNGAMFPQVRMRRTRVSPTWRELVSETLIKPSDFIYPMFVVPGEGIRQEISALPNQYHLSVDQAVVVAHEAYSLGVKAILLFGIPDSKDAEGSQAACVNGPVARAIREIKSAIPEMVVITDVCLCQYTDHGHCGIIKDGQVDNDASLRTLADVALSHAQAGADMVAPSDMMDGHVAALRDKLDRYSFENIPIMAYAAKYASAFYGPFRQAANSSPQFGDRRAYQMDPANSREAMREVALDIAEGADIIMIKPALAYLDIVRQARQNFDLPLAAYNVSGEYAMVKAAAANGWIDEKAVVLESLLGIKRAGADLIITYHALDAAGWL